MCTSDQPIAYAEPLITWSWYPPEGAWLVEYTTPNGASDSDMMIFDPVFAQRHKEIHGE